MPLSTFEKIVIVFSLIIGFLGAVMLVYFNQPAIISSIFLATGIATLVYYFLGGISDANFKMGPIKLGGSIAALIASAWLINSQLKDQITTPETMLTLNSKQELVNNYGKVLGKINLDKSNFSLGKELNLLINDSIELGKLNLGTLHLSKKFEVITSNKINLGSIENNDFINRGLFNSSNLVTYAEIKFDLRMSPFDSNVNEDFWEAPNRDLKNRYHQLPFKLKPIYINESDRTSVTYEDNTKDYELERGTLFAIEIDSEKSIIYYVRIRNLKRNLEKTSYDNFVIYQIFGFEKTLS